MLVAADLTPGRGRDAGPRTGWRAWSSRSAAPPSHSAILARARGIPAVVGAGPRCAAASRTGRCSRSTAAPGRSSSTRPRTSWRAFRSGPRPNAQRHAPHPGSGRQRPPTTRDGTADPGRRQHRLARGRDARPRAVRRRPGRACVRTEFLFLDRAARARRGRAGSRLPGRRRGARRPADHAAHPRCRRRQAAWPTCPPPHEANPFLGLRGLRHSLAHPALLADQLLAIVRVAHDAPVSLMFPMVSTPSELLEARRMLDDAIKDVGRGEPESLRFGIMVEVPAAALKAASFAPHVDFLSIGTNDLTQYAMAAERGNGALAGLVRPARPRRTAADRRGLPRRRRRARRRLRRAGRGRARHRVAARPRRPRTERRPSRRAGGQRCGSPCRPVPRAGPGRLRPPDARRDGRPGVGSARLAVACCAPLEPWSRCRHARNVETSLKGPPLSPYDQVPQEQNRPKPLGFGLSPMSCDTTRRPRQDSNLRARLRRPVLPAPHNFLSTPQSRFAPLWTPPVAWSAAVRPTNRTTPMRT